VFFWSNETGEPVHIHITVGNPSSSSAKVWLTRNGGFIIASNDSGLSEKELNGILKVLPVHYFYICSEWKRFFSTDEIRFFC
jgi:hypothetical protein